MRRTLALVAAGTLAVLALGACTPQPPAAEEPQPAPAGSTETTDAATPPSDGASAYAWLDTELTDAVTGETFRLSDRKGEPVLLHAFAVW